MINETALQMFSESTIELFKLIDLRFTYVGVAIFLSFLFLLLFISFLIIVLNNKINDETKITLNSNNYLNEKIEQMNIKSTKFISWNTAIEKRLKYLEDYLNATHK